jgi:hypothetical protein
MALTKSGQTRCRALIVLVVGCAFLSACRNAKDERRPVDRSTSTERDTAIELARAARTLSHGQGYTNEEVIRNVLQSTKGHLRIVGWQALLVEEEVKFRFKNDPHFDRWLVWYGIELDGEQRGWPFEVNLAAQIVRKVAGDPVLEKRYGWSSDGLETQPGRPPSRP